MGLNMNVGPPHFYDSYTIVTVIQCFFTAEKSRTKKEFYLPEVACQGYLYMYEYIDIQKKVGDEAEYKICLQMLKQLW